MVKARETACLTGGFAGQFNIFHYQAAKIWSRPPRIIGKAQIIRGKENPRFVVMNLLEDQWAAEEPRITKITGSSSEGIYRHLYRARSDMENRIKNNR